MFEIQYNKLRFLERKEVKDVKNKLKEQFGFEEELNYYFLQNEKGKLFVTSRKISDVELEGLRINTIGMYFGQLKDGRTKLGRTNEENKLRLSIEGTQLIGKDCKKNVVELNDSEIKEWMCGEEVRKEGLEVNEFYIVKRKDDFLGCGKFYGEKLLNYIPKVRRVLHSELV